MTWVICFARGQNIATYGQYTYFIYHLHFKIDVAENRCDLIDGTLAVIYNETISQLLINIIRNSPSKYNPLYQTIRCTTVL